MSKIDEFLDFDESQLENKVFKVLKFNSIFLLLLYPIIFCSFFYIIAITLDLFLPGKWIFYIFLLLFSRFFYTFFMCGVEDHINSNLLFCILRLNFSSKSKFHKNKNFIYWLNTKISTLFFNSLIKSWVRYETLKDEAKKEFEFFVKNNNLDFFSKIKNVNGKAKLIDKTENVELLSYVQNLNRSIKFYTKFRTSLNYNTNEDEDTFIKLFNNKIDTQKQFSRENQVNTTEKTLNQKVLKRFRQKRKKENKNLEKDNSKKELINLKAKKSKRSKKLFDNRKKRKKKLLNSIGENKNSTTTKLDNGEQLNIEQTNKDEIETFPKLNTHDTDETKNKSLTNIIPKQEIENTGLSNEKDEKQPLNVNKSEELKKEFEKTINDNTLDTQNLTNNNQNTNEEIREDILETSKEKDISESSKDIIEKNTFLSSSNSTKNNLITNQKKEEKDLNKLKYENLRKQNKEKKSHFIAQKVDWENLSKNKAEIGLIGEEIVLELERTKLQELGLDKLIFKLEHSSVVKGDGLGYDILSFNELEEEIYIEVKATTGNEFSNLFFTSNELEFMKTKGDKYYLYRIYNLNIDIRNFDYTIYQGAESILSRFEFLPNTFKLKPIN